MNIIEVENRHRSLSGEYNFAGDTHEGIFDVITNGSQNGKIIVIWNECEIWSKTNDTHKKWNK